MMTNNNFNTYAFPPYDSALEAITASNICVLEHDGDRWGTRFDAMARNENAGFVSKLASRRECLAAIAKHQRANRYASD